MAIKPYYQEKGIVIYHGDCRDILPQLEPVDLVLTDPPYGINARLGMGGGHKGEGGMWKNVGIAGDESVDLRDEVISLLNLPFAVFAAARTSAPPDTRISLVWNKGLHTGAGDLRLPWKPHIELIHIGGKGWQGKGRGSAIVQFNAIAGCVGNQNDGYRAHPFEKPVTLMNYLIRYAPSGIILDPFLGSGTTLVAAKNLGRKAIGIEIEEKYCEIAVKRLAQGVLFGEN